ncbi:MAG: SUMF1/EgtB/PvdO family nonheme iron enzyme [Nitrospirae bacterium]|nr:SUMF1/EgtB/PvdO family nonheme iron enzyme [Nitrospirota bacterium]
MRFFVGSWALPVLLAACEAKKQDAPPPVAGVGTIEGRVVPARAGVFIRVERTSLATTTDSAGKFRIHLAPEGQISVTAEYRDEAGATFIARRTVTVEKEEKTTVEDLRVVPAGTIRGMARLKGGSIRAGIEVVLVGTRHEARTENDGSFVMGAVAPDAYTVAFVSTGFGAVQREDVEVAEGETTDLGWVELEAESDPGNRTVYGTVTGMVTDTEGSPISEAVISATPGAGLAMTDENGTYTLGGLFPVTVSLLAQKVDYVSRSLSVFITAGQKASGDITLTRRRRLGDARHTIFSNEPPTVALNCPDVLAPGGKGSVSIRSVDPDGDHATLSSITALSGAVLSESIIPCAGEERAACATVEVVAPSSGGEVTLQVSATDGSLRVDGRCEMAVADGTGGVNQCPVVSMSGPLTVSPGRTLLLRNSRVDADGDPVSVRWQATGGRIMEATDEAAAWTAPGHTGQEEIRACVTDGKCEPSACATIRIQVAESPADSRAPTCAPTGASSARIHETVTLTAAASDPDGDSIRISWSSSGGHLSSKSGPVVTWTAGDVPGPYGVTCTARDEKGSEGTGQIGISVTKPPVGKTCPTLAARGPALVSPGGKVSIDFLASDTNQPEEVLTGGCTMPPGSYDVSNIRATGAANFGWTAPDVPGVFVFHCSTSNSVCTRSFEHAVQVVAAPVLGIGVSCSSPALLGGQSTSCAVTASEQADFRWTASGGRLSSTTGSEVTWTAPSCPRCAGMYALTVAASAADGRVNAAQQTIGVQLANRAPEVSLDGPAEADPLQLVGLTARASDADDLPAPLACDWTASGGTLAKAEGCGEQVWTAPAVPGKYSVFVVAGDSDRSSSASTEITVKPPAGGRRPTGSISAPAKVAVGAPADLACSGMAPDAKLLTYAWNATGGSFSQTDGTSASAGTVRTRWTAPNAAGPVTITCIIQDDASPPSIFQDRHIVEVTALPSGAAYECDENTLALYHLDETTGTVAFDACGERHGVRKEGEIDQDGVAGRSYFFDGADDFLKIPDALNPGVESRFTIEAWFKLKCDCPGSGLTLVSKGGGSEGTFDLRVMENGQIRFSMTPFDRSALSPVASVRTVHDDGWHHAAAAYDGRTLSLHLDGRLESSGAYHKTLGDSDFPLLIGASDSDEDGRPDARFFKGWIDEVRISSAARASNEMNVVRESRALKWAKSSGNPIFAATDLWEMASVAYPSVLKVSSTYVMFYQGGSIAAWNIGEATSKDGISWTRLPVPIVTIGSSGAWDAGRVQMPSIYYDGAEYWMYYGGKAKTTDTSSKLGLAKSTDGLKFTKHESNPLLEPGGTAAWDEITGFPGSVVRESGEFRIYYTGYTASESTKGRIGLATSSDGVKWTRHDSNPLLAPGDTGQFDDTSVQNPRAVKIGAIWYLFYEGVKKGGTTTIGLATSLDGIRWTKADSNPVLGAGQAWEVLPQLQTGFPLLDGDQIKLYYSATTLTGAKIALAYELPETFIPAGRFVMGSDADEGLATERPEHVVYLSPYWMDRFEVTNAAFRSCVDTGPCSAPSGGSGSATRSSYYGDAAFDLHPVVRVTWNQADQYCRWIGKRLPTEAEWEKAARGPYPDERPYPWGDGEPSCWPANIRGCVGDTERVGFMAGSSASPYGLFDLGGNVAEWVGDWSDSTYYGVSLPRDPAGPATGSLKTARGGSWNDAEPKQTTRVSYRESSAGAESFASTEVGFRCARNP